MAMVFMKMRGRERPKEVRQRAGGVYRGLATAISSTASLKSEQVRPLMRLYSVSLQTTDSIAANIVLQYRPQIVLQLIIQYCVDEPTRKRVRKNNCKFD